MIHRCHRVRWARVARRGVVCADATPPVRHVEIRRRCGVRVPGLTCGGMARCVGPPEEAVVCCCCGIGLAVGRSLKHSWGSGVIMWLDMWLSMWLDMRPFLILGHWSLHLGTCHTSICQILQDAANSSTHTWVNAHTNAH